MCTFPTQAQKSWMELQYGMFLHFGPNTFEGKGWGDGTYPAEMFDPKNLSTAQWAAAAAEAGMKYAVLTAKHVDGFCLWPSRYTEYSVKNSPCKKDIVASFVEDFRREGLKVGLYYCLWDTNFKQYENDEVFAEYVQNQVRELLSNYGDVVEIWFDGAWVKDHPTKEWPYRFDWEKDPASGLTFGDRFRWKELYELVHSLQPGCLVVNNASSDRPGGIKYHPVDLRTAEHYNFVWEGKICEPIADSVFENEQGQKVFIPLEFCTSLNPHWFWNEKEGYSHPSVEAICGWYRTARKYDANLLLNVGPDKSGRIPEYHRQFLKQAALELGIK